MNIKYTPLIAPINTRLFRSTPLRLSMNFLVKNEADIIEDNIRFHSTQGVDCFVVMDNGSTDHTADVVRALSEEFEIEFISRPIKDYQQSNWKTEMAFISRKKLKADWSIANDADEFWVSEEGNLKHELSKWGSVILSPRFNMLPRLEDITQDNFHFTDTDYRVKFPSMNKQGDLIHDDQLSIMLSNTNGKVRVNNQGLIRVKGGNHRAWHWWEKLNFRKSSDCRVYHYPIRSKALFENNIQNRAELLDRGITKMGDHYRRWTRQMRDQKLDEEFSRLAISKEDAAVLMKFGLITKDKETSDYIKNAIKRSHQ